MTIDARMWDGGVFPGPVPLTSSFGTNQTLMAGAATAIQIPSAPGTHTFTAGWDAPGYSTQATVQGIGCSTTCQPWQFCQATVDGGECQSLNLTLTWTSPDAGLAFNSSTVQARVVATRTAGSIPASLTSIPIFTPQGTATSLTGSAGTYLGSLPLLAPDGEKAYLAGWPDGGPTAPLRITRDTTPPAVVLTAVPRPAALPDPWPDNPNAWKKDETALFAVSIDGGRTATVADVFIVDSGVVITQTTPTACGCSNCQCFEAPLATAAEFPSQANPSRTAVIVGIHPISDQAGNASAPSNIEIAVTRFLWRRLAQPSFLSLTEDGVLVMNNNGRIEAMTRDGGTLWTASAPTNFVPVLGASSLYVNENDGTSSRIRQISLATGLSTATFCESIAVDFTSNLALATTATGMELPVIRRGTKLIFGTPACPSIELESTSFSSNLMTALEPGGEIGVYLDLNGSIRKLVFDGTGLADAGAAPVIGGSEQYILTPTHVLRSWNQTVIAHPRANISNQSSQASYSSALISPFVAGNGSIWGFNAAYLIRQDFNSATAFTTGDLIPYLGPIAPGFVVKTADSIWVNRPNEVTQLRLDGGTIWASQGPVGTFIIDVPRTPSGAKACGSGLGRLYVANPTSPSDITAYLVYTKGLDGLAFWPVNGFNNVPGHDFANSRNQSRSVAPWSCP